MEYENVKEELIQRLMEKMDGGCKVEPFQTVKNNGCIHEGVIVRRDKAPISSILYPDDWIHAVMDGSRTLEEAAEGLYRQYEDSLLKDEEWSKEIMEYDKIKDRIIYRLVNLEMNRELLSDVPYIPFLDLAQLFYVTLSLREEFDAATRITKSHLKMWGVSLEEIRRQAEENTPRLFRAECRSITELLGMVAPPEEGLAPGDCPMYVLSNSRSIFGAACIMYPNALKEAAEKIGGDVYVLPSSVHETLLVPVSSVDEPARLSQMVKQVNRETLQGEDVLSDHPYLYTLASDRLSAA